MSACILSLFMYLFYILESQVTRRLYIGQSKNLSRTLTAVREGQSRYSRGNGPWKILYFQQCSTKMEAMMLEHRLKKWKNPEKIRDWIGERSRLARFPCLR